MKYATIDVSGYVEFFENVSLLLEKQILNKQHDIHCYEGMRTRLYTENNILKNRFAHEYSVVQGNADQHSNFTIQGFQLKGLIDSKARVKANMKRFKEEQREAQKQLLRQKEQTFKRLDRETDLQIERNELTKEQIELIQNKSKLISLENKEITAVNKILKEDSVRILFLPK